MEHPSDDDESTDSNDSDRLDETKMKASIKGRSEQPKSPGVDKPSNEDDMLPTGKVTESTIERRQKRRRELNRLSKMRRRKHRKDVAATLESEVSRLTAEHNALRAENEELRREWDQCERLQTPPRSSFQMDQMLSASFAPTYQNLRDRTLPAGMAFSQPLPNALPPFRDPYTGLHRIDQQQQQPVSNLAAGIFPGLQSIPLPGQGSIYPNSLSFPHGASLGLSMPLSQLPQEPTGNPTWLAPTQALLGTLIAPQALAQWQRQSGVMFPPNSTTAELLNQLRSISATQQRSQNFYQPNDPDEEQHRHKA